MIIYFKNSLYYYIIEGRRKKEVDGMFFNIVFNWPNFFSFLIGLGTGLIIFALLYLLLVLTTLKNKKYIVASNVNDVTDEEIKEIIKNSQAAFKDKDLRGEEGVITYATNLATELVIHIARRYFPKSKHPVLELSIDELILLCNYISKRVDEILGHRGLRILRKIKISTIVGLSDTKKIIEDNPIVKATKRYKIYETLAAAKKVINVVNPVWWAKKLITNSVMKIITNKLCLVILGIIGEETYKIYSKSVFNVDVTIDSGIDEIVKDIDKDIRNSFDEELPELESSHVLEEPTKPTKKTGWSLFKRKGE